MISAGPVLAWLRGGVATAQQVVGRRATATAAGAGPGNPPDVSLVAPGGPQFVQPDQTTCGSCSLVMAKMINTTSYGAQIVAAGPDGEPDPDAVKTRFDTAVLAMHATTSGWKDGDGGWQMPWPQQLGTAPWAVARQMSISDGSGRPGIAYRARLVNPVSPAADYAAIVAAVAAGQSVPLFIGNDVMARHVVLVTGADPDHLSLYDPSSGVWVTVPYAGFTGHAFDVAGWNQPWFTVLPV